MIHITQQEINQFYQGTLNSEVRMHMMEHVAVCEMCAAKLADGAVEEKLISPPKGLQERILQNTVEQKVVNLKSYQKKKSRELFFYSVKVTTAASIAIFLMFSNTIYAQKNGAVEIGKLAQVTETVRSSAEYMTNQIRSWSFFDQDENMEENHHDTEKK